jgi:hypothetical protein
MDSEIHEMDTSGRMLLGYSVYWIDSDTDPTEMIFGKSVEVYETWKQALKKAEDVAEKHKTKDCIRVLSKVDEDLQKDCWIYGGSKAYILKFITDKEEYGTVYIVPVWQVLP